MPIKSICEREVVTVPEGLSVYETAKIMKALNLGNVIVVGDQKERNNPIGIITDRDIVIKIVADDGDPMEICAGDIMSLNLLVLKDHQGIQESLDMMSAKSVRRAPIVDDKNNLVGIAMVDDLLVLIAEEVESLAKLIRKQTMKVRK